MTRFLTIVATILITLLSIENTQLERKVRRLESEAVERTITVVLEQPSSIYRNGILYMVTGGGGCGGPDPSTCPIVFLTPGNYAIKTRTTP